MYRNKLVKCFVIFSFNFESFHLYVSEVSTYLATFYSYVFLFFTPFAIFKKINFIVPLPNHYYKYCYLHSAI